MGQFEGTQQADAAAGSYLLLVRITFRNVAFCVCSSLRLASESLKVEEESPRAASCRAALDQRQGATSASVDIWFSRLLEGESKRS